MNEITEKFDSRIKFLESHNVEAVAFIDSVKGEFKYGLRMNPKVITSLKKSTIITSAGASTRIEGSKLNDSQVEEILKKIKVSKFSDRDSQEVQGYLEVLENVFNSFETLPLRESIINSLHFELLKYSDKDKVHRGKYKKQENIVGIPDSKGNIAEIIFETTPAWLTTKEMTEIVDYTFEALDKKRFHPLLVIANFIIEFLKIHPFQDGNGRLSRILTNLLLLRSGYQFVQYVSHEQIIEKRKEEYYFSLRVSQNSFKTENPTINPWLNYFLSVVKDQATLALVHLNEERFEDTLSPIHLKVWKNISNAKALGPLEIANETDSNIATVRQALKNFLKLKKVKRIGSGPQTKYIKIA